MKTVKLLFAAAVVSLLCLNAQAQFFGGLYGSQSITIPSNLTNGTAYAFTCTIDCKNAKTFSVQFTGASSNTADSSVKVVLFPSLNGSTADSTTTQVLTVPLSGTAQITLSTNFTVNSTGYGAISGYVTNANTFFATNCSLIYAVKPGY